MHEKKLPIEDYLVFFFFKDKLKTDLAVLQYQHLCFCEVSEKTLRCGTSIHTKLALEVAQLITKGKSTYKTTVELDAFSLNQQSLFWDWNMHHSFA